MTAVLVTRPEKREELHQALQSLLTGIQGEPGCLECLGGQDLGGEPRFLLHLVWEDAHALQGFLGSDPYRILLGAMNVLASPTRFRVVAAENAFQPVGTGWTCPAAADHPGRSSTAP